MSSSTSRTSLLFLVAFYLTAVSFLFGSGGGVVVRSHRITAELFPGSHSLQVTDEMIISSIDREIHLYLNADFNVASVTIDQKEVPFTFSPIGDKNSSQMSEKNNPAEVFALAGRLTISAEPGVHSLMVRYSGKLFDKPSTGQYSREYVANQSSGIIDAEGTFLSPECFWYPRAENGMSRFSIKTTTPSGYETVTQGRRLRHEELEGKLHVEWANSHPSDNLFLQAGPYEVKQDEVDGIKVYTYFFKGGEDLSDLYLQKSKYYLDMYNRLLGPYPYEKFAVAENFFETGYGMPSWTLLGRTVIRLPFIPDTSLPHEICHNWWGNGVFVDYSQGNWCEGLTVYCADYLLKKKQSEADAAGYRRQTNRDYSSYVRDQNDFPLTAFRSRHNPVTRAVGYGKTMMVFHDLQRKIGEERFFLALRRLMKEFRFHSASWKDVLGVFEKEGGIKLDDFYRQWVERGGAPAIRLEDVTAQAVTGGYRVEFHLHQLGDPYQLDGPLTLKTEAGPEVRSIKLDQAHQTFTVECEGIPLRLEIDPDHQLFRSLYPEEIPPSIAKVFGSGSQLIILGSDESESRRQEFTRAAEMINRTQTAVIQKDIETEAVDFEGKSVLILGRPAEATASAEILKVLRKPLPPSSEAPASSHVAVYFHPEDMSLGVLVFGANPEGTVIDVARKLPHYGKYSYLVFLGSRNVDKGIWDVESSPLIHSFR